MEQALSLYIHIPFCMKKCAYCDFCSYPDALTRADGYLDALERELHMHSERLGYPKLSTLYIGGGTPTLLEARQLSRLLKAVKECFDIKPDVEATIEANPGTLAPEKIEACVQGGINRISLGMQAYQPSLLHMLGRIHDFSQVESGVHMARMAGIDNISVDLMYALPGQTMAQWRESLRAALELGITHLSCYELTLEEGTPLALKVRSGKLHIPEEETCLRMASIAREETRQAGLHRYEISNYAREGFESAHNKTYWECKAYIGAGCAAHGYDVPGVYPGVRYANTACLERYIAGEGTPMKREALSMREARFERLMLSLRMTRGLNMARFRHDFQVSIHEAFGPELRRFEEQGFLKEEDGFLLCTSQGMDIQNALLVELLAADEN